MHIWTQHNNALSAMPLHPDKLEPLAQSQHLLYSAWWATPSLSSLAAPHALELHSRHPGTAASLPVLKALCHALQGVGNTISGLFGGLPGAGATMRTVVNIRSGGRTPAAGALHAVILFGVATGQQPGRQSSYLAWLPVLDRKGSNK